MLTEIFHIIGFSKKIDNKNNNQKVKSLAGKKEYTPKSYCSKNN